MLETKIAWEYDTLCDIKSEAIFSKDDDGNTQMIYEPSTPRMPRVWAKKKNQANRKKCPSPLPLRRIPEGRICFYHPGGIHTTSYSVDGSLDLGTWTLCDMDYL